LRKRRIRAHMAAMISADLLLGARTETSRPIGNPEDRKEERRTVRQGQGMA